MLVPKYWAEARIQKRTNSRQITVKRLGWSDESEQDAQQNADRRAKDAFLQIESGQKINKIERKMPYNGAVGVPIREEIIKNIKDSVITRNSYGALCINTPDVLFADIDFENEPSNTLYFFSFITLIALIISSGLYFDLCSWSFLETCKKTVESSCFWAYFVAVVFGTLLLTSLFTRLLFKLSTFIIGDAENRAKKRIKSFIRKNPKWNLNIYRTPAGYRVLVLHQTFTPNSKETLAFFHALKTDPIYVQMCKNQQCFRARISPKPWRIGINTKPRFNIWTVNLEKNKKRQQWVQNYEKIATKYASCRFEESLGSNILNAKADYIRLIHDQYCKVKTNFPIA